MPLEYAALRGPSTRLVESVSRGLDRGNRRLREGPLAAGRKPSVATQFRLTDFALAENAVEYPIVLESPVIFFGIAATIVDHLLG